MPYYILFDEQLLKRMAQTVFAKYYHGFTGSLLRPVLGSLRSYFLQFTVLMHFQRDIATADQLAVENEGPHLFPGDPLLDHGIEGR